MRTPPLPRRRGTGGNSPASLSSASPRGAHPSCRRPPDHPARLNLGPLRWGGHFLIDRNATTTPRRVIRELRKRDGGCRADDSAAPLGAGGLRPSLRLFRDRMKGAVSRGAASFFSMLVPGLVYPFSPSGAPINRRGSRGIPRRAAARAAIVMVGSEGPST
jgi:hypothetical protein